MKFLLSSRPQTGIRSPPISGPRPSFLARSGRGSCYLASAGPVPSRTLSGSRAAAEQSDSELRSFYSILRRREDEKGSSKQQGFTFFCLSPSLLEIRIFDPCCCDLGLSASFDISSISRPRGRYRVPSLGYLAGRVAFDTIFVFQLSFILLLCTSTSTSIENDIITAAALSST